MEKLKNLIIILFIFFVCYLSVLNYLETKKLKLSLEKSQLKDEVTTEHKSNSLEFLYTPPSVLKRVDGETVSLRCSTQGDISEMKGKWTYSNSFCDGVEIKSEVSKSSNILNVNVTVTKPGVYECQIQQKESIIKKKILVIFATIESNILSTAQKQQLIDWFPVKEMSFNFALCLRTPTVDERKPEENCDGLAKTLTIIKDGVGCIFGGYSSTSLDAKTVGNSFLFDFHKNRTFEARSPRQNKQCTYSGPERKYGACFGRNDLVTYETIWRNGYLTIYYKSMVGKSYHDHGSWPVELGCAASSDSKVSLMEIFYRN